MELQWLRRERQRGRGAITRLSLWRHLLVVASRHRLVCVNRTTELSGWTWSLTFPPADAEEPEKETELDKHFALIFKIFLKFLNMLIVNSPSWTLAFENVWHLTQDFEFISEDSAKYRFIQLWWEPLSRILAHWKHTHFHTYTKSYTKIQLCLAFSGDKLTLIQFTISYF